jgi:curli production assembly/transport component CsgG
MAVTEAIEKAVASLVMEGIKDGIWESAAPKEIDSVMLKYKNENEEADVTAIYGRKLTDRRSKFAIVFWRSDFNGWRPSRSTTAMVRGALKYF